MSYSPQVTKERVYATNGVLNRCDGNYSIPATDTRWIKLDPSKIELKLVWEEGKKVSELVQKYGADYGFNFPFFWNNKPVSDTVIDGKQIATGTGKVTKWHGFAYVDGKPQIGMFDPSKITGAKDFLVKTSPLLIENGNPCWAYYDNYDQTAPDIGGTTRCQRTFIGLDADGSLILAVGDGRTKWDRGLSLEEMALFMKGKGAVVSLNGDGGSSSVIANKSGVMSQNSGSAERAVNHAVLVFIKPDAQAPDSTTKTIPKLSTTATVEVVDKATGNTIATDTAFISDEGVSYVPTRFVYEKLGDEIKWDGSKNLITIYK